MKNKYVALLLGWLVPGLGHAYIGRRWKAVVFFVTIMASAIVGLWMGDFRDLYFSPSHPLDHLQYYAEVGNGIFALAGAVVMSAVGAAPIEIAASASTLARVTPIADLYLMLAGLLNFVVAANAYDVAAGRQE